MKEILRKHHISFVHAIDGIAWAIRTQPNFRVHIILSFLVLLAGSLLSISPIEMIVLVFTILLGLTAEMINTSLESMTDLITKEWRAEAKTAKDVSAGMMLVVACGAVIVGCFILLPHIFQKFT